MPGYHLFQVPTLGMRSQAHALNTIGINVANVNTGGYKRTDTQFETLISKTLQHESDLGGVNPKDYQRIDAQGFINASSRDLDIAINGSGFFYVSPTFDVTDEVYFTRDGSFQMGIVEGQTSSVTADDGNTITVSNGYLVDKNGYYVLGMAADPNTGLFSSSGTLQPLRIDEWAFIDQSTPTTTANLSLNLPSTNGIVTDHQAVVLAANGGTNNDDLETYSIEVVDSNGAKQTAQMNFTKSSDNTWQVSATTSRASSPQADTVMLAGTVEAGDSYTVTVNGTAVTYTVLGTEGSLSGVRDAVVAAINANATINANVTASAGNSNGEITLTANATGTSFTTSASASNSAPNVAQVDTATLAGTVEAGDKYSITVNGATVTYTVTGAEADIDDIRDNFVNAINTDPTLSAIVTAAGTATAGEFTITSDTAGTAISTTLTTPTTGATVDNTATFTTTTANFSAQSDNTASVGTSTTYQTTAAQPLSFNGDGELPTSTTPLSFSFTFADGATATVAIDMSDMKQYGADFVEFNYDHNGLTTASMTGTHFDEAGHIVGSFQDGTERSIYKLALAQFSNPDGLEMKNGMVFRESTESGSPTTVFADETGLASFTPYAVELSNVDIATEFSRMIMVQNAYNSSATVFKTVDEMVTVARDLKA
jgi:flagellar hook-basal body protein